MPKIGMLNTQVQSQQQLIQETKENLKQQEDWISTPDLRDELHRETETGFDKQYIRSLLTYIRQHLEQENKIKTKKRLEGGNPTIYWRHNNQ